MTTIRVLGCSDAFNSGGRFFPCFWVEGASTRFLLDCGPTALLALKRAAIDPDALDALLISHFHGDHIGGIPFLEIELGILRRRTRPVAVGGPPEVAEWVGRLIENMYPALNPAHRVQFAFTEWIDREAVEIGDVRVTGIPVVHTAESHPYGLRVELDGRVIAYSGDTEWTDALIPLAENADLFICEATTFSLEVNNHLSYETLMRHREQLTCRRILITHMSDEMLQHLPVDDTEAAEDGLIIEL